MSYSNKLRGFLNLLHVYPVTCVHVYPGKERYTCMCVCDGALLCLSPSPVAK